MDNNKELEKIKRWFVSEMDNRMFNVLLEAGLAGDYDVAIECIRALISHLEGANENLIIGDDEKYKFYTIMEAEGFVDE